MTQRSELACIHHSWSCFSSLCSGSLLFFCPPINTNTLYLCEKSIFIYSELPLPLSNRLDSCTAWTKRSNSLYLSRRFHSLITNLFCFVFRYYFIFSTLSLDCISFSDVQLWNFFSFSGQNFGRHFSFVDNFIDLQLDLYMLKTQTR